MCVFSDADQSMWNVSTAGPTSNRRIAMYASCPGGSPASNPPTHPDHCHLNSSGTRVWTRRCARRRCRCPLCSAGHLYLRTGPVTAGHFAAKLRVSYLSVQSPIGNCLLKRWTPTALSVAARPPARLTAVDPGQTLNAGSNIQQQPQDHRPFEKRYIHDEGLSFRLMVSRLRLLWQ